MPHQFQAAENQLDSSLQQKAELGTKNVIADKYIYLKQIQIYKSVFVALTQRHFQDVGNINLFSVLIRSV